MITDYIRNLSSDMRDKISSITISTESDGYHVIIEVNDWLNKVDIMSIESVDILETTRHPGYRLTAPETTDIAREIIDLNLSGLIGPIEAARVDVSTANIDAVLDYGYPHWLIKPQRLSLSIRDKWQTVAEAAQFLSVTPRRVRVLCKSGRINGAMKVGRDWVIPRPFKVQSS